jgi:D-lactate dehydrogenase
MKAIVYSIKPFEKEFFEHSNLDKHELTFESRALDIESADMAKDNLAVIVFTNDDVSATVIKKLQELGVKYVVTRSTGTDHIDKDAIITYGLSWANVPSYSPQAIAEHAVAMAFALNRRLVKSDAHSHHFDFRNDGLVGFNFSGKTVGIIGMGNTGQAAAKIFYGLGCKVLAYDPYFPENTKNVEPVTLELLFSSADVISLHLPLTADTKHLVCKETLDQMKDDIMIINTSRGALIKTTDVLEALKTGKIGYLGLDVYEYEKHLFFEDHSDDAKKDTLLVELLKHENVLITPHQAYLTKEALHEIMEVTIQHLDNWEV